MSTSRLMQDARCEVAGSTTEAPTRRAGFPRGAGRARPAAVELPQELAAARQSLPGRGRVRGADVVQPGPSRSISTASTAALRSPPRRCSPRRRRGRGSARARPGPGVVGPDLAHLAAHRRRQAGRARRRRPAAPAAPASEGALDQRQPAGRAGRTGANATPSRSTRTYAWPPLLHRGRRPLRHHDLTAARPAALHVDRCARRRSRSTRSATGRCPAWPAACRARWRPLRGSRPGPAGTVPLTSTSRTPSTGGAEHQPAGQAEQPEQRGHRQGDRQPGAALARPRARAGRRARSRRSSRGRPPAGTAPRARSSSRRRRRR